MPSYTQSNRVLQISTALGPDVLIVERFSAEEAVSRLFEYRLECVSENSSIDPLSLVRTPVTVTVKIGDRKAGEFHGIVRRFAQGGRDEVFTRYELEVVPAFWFLTQNVNCRIFQNKTVVDIAKTILAGIDCKFELSGTHSPREMCVQYMESDFAFISRLLEEEGIYYYFQRSASGHTLVVADSSTSFKPGATLPVAQMVTDSGPTEEAITDLALDYSARSGKSTVTDYNELQPSVDLLTSTSGSQTRGGESFVYPAKVGTRGDADRIARLRMEAIEATQKMLIGTSVCPSLVPGSTLTINEHYRKDMNGPAHVLHVRHEVTQDLSGAGDQVTYANTFEAIPASVPYRPPVVTPKPRIAGTQPAVVVGPAGEEIFVDKYGRVKVQFFWDREGKRNDASSCWVRVATPIASKTWGVIFTPRIGDEILVAFAEGDPDRPYVLGMLWNAERMPPYSLPANKTQSGWKTRSSLKGDPSNFNELRFEDKKGSEEVYLQAEKDWNTVVEHDRTTKVGHDETKVIETGNQSLEIKKGKQDEKIYDNRTVVIDQGNDKLTLNQGNREVTLSMGNDKLTLSQGNREVKIAMGNEKLTVSMGNIEIKADLGKVTTEAMQGIELKVGQSSIKLDQMGVTIKGMMVKVEGQVQTEIKGVMTQVNGDAMLMAKGGITMIN